MRLNEDKLFFIAHTIIVSVIIFLYVDYPAYAMPYPLKYSLLGIFYLYNVLTVFAAIAFHKTKISRHIHRTWFYALISVALSVCLIFCDY